MISNTNLGIIGVGNMGGAILRGALAGGVSPSKIFIYDASADQLNKLSATSAAQPARNLADIANTCETVIIAVKPDKVLKTLREIQSFKLNRNTLFVSVAAGVTIAGMEEALGGSARVIRTMPNTPAMVGEGMTVICPGTNVVQPDVDFVRELFGLFGKTEIITEDLIDASTGINGCAPAYVYMFIEAMADAGVMHGLSRSAAYAMASQAVLGASKMVLETQRHPGELKDAVCSPKGVTIEAVAALERGGFRGCVINAVDAAVQKSIRMNDHY